MQAIRKYSNEKQYRASQGKAKWHGIALLGEAQYSRARYCGVLQYLNKNGGKNGGTVSWGGVNTVFGRPVLGVLL